MTPDPHLQGIDADGAGLTKCEIARLSEGAPDLWAWGEDMMVPFEVWRLKSARITWLNRRWLGERGLDVRDAYTRRRAEAWMLREFAYVVPNDDISDALCEDDVKTVHADRYGGENGFSAHGGSGRVATIGAFQVKGVGLTPLAGIPNDWGHSHGCAWLEESIREAVFAEIVDAEFPSGAVPVIAIVDVGLTTKTYDTTSGIRALLIRPAVLRLAHFERAPLFVKTSSGMDTDQLADVRRTQDAIQQYVRGGGLEPDGLISTMRKHGEQIAFGQVNRLFSGGCFSSNLALDGRLLDFGGMRSLPNWAYTKVLDDSPGFGRDLLIMSANIRSLSFYTTKFVIGCPSQKTIEDQLNTAVMAGYTAIFESEMIRVLGAEVLDENVRKRALDAVIAHFKYQQKHTINIANGDKNGLPCFASRIGDWRGGMPVGHNIVIEDMYRSFQMLGLHDQRNDEDGVGQDTGGIDYAIITAIRTLSKRPALDDDSIRPSIMELEHRAFNPTHIRQP